LLDAGDLQSLPKLDGTYQGRSLVKIVGSAGVEPCEAAAEPRHGKLSRFEIGLVHAGNFELSARRRLYRLGNLHDRVIVEVEPGHRPVRFRVGRLFLDRDRTIAVELDDAVAARILHPVRKHAGSYLDGRVGGKDLGEPVAVEDVVAEHEGGGTTIDELL